MSSTVAIVTFTLLKPGAAGKQDAYRTVVLTNALVSSIRRFSSSSEVMEEVTLAYESRAGNHCARFASQPPQ